MKKIEIQVPALGESITEATVAKWFIKKGEHIKKDAVLLELETDKVSQEIYASESGILEAVFFQEGEDVNIGDILGVIDPTSEEAADKEEEKEKHVEEKEVMKTVMALKTQKIQNYVMKYHEQHNTIIQVILKD